MSDALKTVIPLHLRVSGDSDGTPRVTLELQPDEKTVLLTRENVDGFLPLLAEHGAPRFRIFDMPAEARAANAVLEETVGPRGAITTQVGRLRDGEGVLMIVRDDTPIDDDHFPILDSRSGSCRAMNVFGSWELPADDCAALMRPRKEAHRMDLANAIAAKIAELPNPDILRDLQVAIERIPGAFVGFVATSTVEIREDWRFEDVDPESVSDAEIHAAIAKAASKAEMADALNEAVDATMSRLTASRPDIFEAPEENEIAP
jgi:hypothetical protein